MNIKKLSPFLVSAILILILALLPVISGCAGSTSTPATSAQAPTSSAPATSSPAAANKTLKLGGCMPLSGPPSAAGIAWKQGWELAVEQINKAGGLQIGKDKYNFDISVEDTKASAEGGTTGATKLVLQENIKFVMGDIADFMIPAIYKVTAEGGALFCESLLATSADVPGSFADVAPDKPLLIRMTPANSELDIIPIQYVIKNYPQVKSIGFIALAFPDYDNLAKVYAANWAPLGLTVSSDYERIAPDTIDFNPIMSRLLATKPDVIYDLRSTLSQFPLVVKAARDAGFNGPIVFPLPANPADAAGAGVNLSDVFTLGVAMDDPKAPDAVKKVITLGRAKYGNKDFIEDSIFAYDQLMMLTQMLQKAQSVDPQTVIKTYETLKKSGDLQSVFGPAYVGGLKKTGVNRVLVRPVPLSRLVNGQGEFIGMFSVDIP